MTGITEIISDGADKLDERYSEEKNLDLTVFLPDWKKYGKSAGVIRNKDIVKHSDMVVAFWDEKSRSTLSSIKFSCYLIKSKTEVRSDSGMSTTTFHLHEEAEDKPQRSYTN